MCPWEHTRDVINDPRLAPYLLYHHALSNGVIIWLWHSEAVQQQHLRNLEYSRRSAAARLATIEAMIERVKVGDLTGIAEDVR